MTPRSPRFRPPPGLDDLIHRIPSGILVFDAGNRVTFVNDALFTVLGLEHGRVGIGMPLETALGEIEGLCPTSCASIEGLAEAVQDRRVFESEWTCGNGQVMAIACKPIDGDRYLVSIRDMATLVRTREELDAARREAEMANESKTQFLATMSHELRTPMTGLMGMVSLLERTRLDADQRRYLGAIAQSADTLLALLNDILDVSKMEAGSLRLEEVAFRPADLLRERLGLFDAKRIAKGLELGLWIDSDLPEAIVGDPLRVGQIVTNLYSNAIKFTERGRIDIALRTEPAPRGAAGEEVCLVLEVADTGIGIDPKSQERIFDPFTQADSSTTRRYGGTGLGLAICKRLAEGMGGSIAIDSRVGAGTTLVVSLRVKRADPADAVSLDEPADLGAVEIRPLRILLAEDDGISRMLIQTVLEEDGHIVVSAANGAEALDAVTDGAPVDVVVMDMNMPIMDGSEATARIKEVRPDLPVVALTADAVPRNRSLYLRSGLDAFLTKPVNWRQFRATLAQLTIPAGGRGSGARSAAGPTPPDDDRSDRDVPNRLRGLRSRLPEDSFERMMALLPLEFDRHMGAIRNGASALDYAEVRQAAHSIKGMMANFGFDEISRTAASIERLSRAAEEGGAVDPAAMNQLIAGLRLKEPDIARTLKRLSG